MTKETQTNVSQNEERKMYALQTGETETNVVFEVEDSKHAKKGESSPKRLTLGTQGDKANANIYLVSWFLLNVGITLYCKAAFSFYKFPYPVIMTAIHVTFTYIGVWICARVGLYKPAPISRETFGSLLWFSVVFTVNIWLSNASLLKASIALHQVTRTTIPLFTMVTSALLFREIYPWSLLPSVIMVIAGVACTVWGDIGFEWMGMMLVLFGCFFSSLKGILTQKTQVGKLGLSTLDVLRVTCPLAAIELLLLGLFNGEVASILAEGMLPVTVYCHLAVLGVIAFGVNFTSFRVAALMNPLTLNIAGNVKQVLTSLLSIMIFGGVLSISLASGIVITALGAFMY
eukprot:Selendium_serpulae@DN3968_c0_g1_i4.p1